MAFNIGLAFSNTTLPRRVLLFMLEHVKKDARGPVLAIWLTTALLSGIIANFAVIALMLAFAWEYLSLFDDPVKKKKTGRCLLLECALPRSWEEISLLWEAASISW